MQDRWLDRFAAIIGRFTPDALTSSVILLLLLAGAAFLFGNSPVQVMDAYYRGLWMLLPFTMQMTLIIVLSSALGATAFFRKAVASLSRLPKTTNQTVALAVLLSAGAAYCYWGLGIALSPIVAVYFAREAEAKGIAIDFPFLLAVVWASNAVWQYGLSASAPLLVATPGHFLQSTIGVVPLSKTIWSPAAILHEITFTIAVIVVGCWLMPKKSRPISQFPNSSRLADAAVPAAVGELSYSERLERKSFFTLALSAVLCGWLYFHFEVKGLSLDINSLNTTLLLLTLLLHGNVKNFTGALEKAVVSSWPVIVLYHLYAGVAGLIQFTNVGERMAGMAAAYSTAHTFPLLTASIGTLFAFFIPSSGGQWAIQGFITVKSALAIGVSASRGILAMSIGDHMGNLTSPFWYVVVAGIVHIDFRTFFGYGLVFAALWFVIGVIVFTFAPC
ncbi:MAG TPA: TIGR00366 family protein [Bryobacteraceae bacterium]|nr:TIGR00366 family protein [Bryobacteraceae bacterium]